MRVRYVLALALVACAGYGPTSTSSSTTTATTTSPTSDHDRIEQAYRARDVRMLKEMVDILSAGDDRTLARKHYIKLELDALVALDCDPFFAAFEPVRGKPNPKTAFASLTADLEPRGKLYIAEQILGVASRCHSAQLFQPGIRRGVPDADDAVWADALIAMDT